MRLVTYRNKGESEDRIGFLDADAQRIAPSELLDIPYSDMNEWITSLSMEEQKRLKGLAEEKSIYTLSVDEVVLRAPIPHPKQDVICLGVNYLEHAREAARFEKESFDIRSSYPVYFSKRMNEAVGHQQAIPAYEEFVDSLDYEVELAVVIGKDAKNVKAEDAEEYIFGYTILNDVSARNLQTRHTQWYFGKSLDGFTPMGPALVTADEISYPPKLKIQSLVNGEIRQDSSTDLLIFDIGYVIEELSRGMTLKAGTIISTGTPQGVGMGFVPPRFLNKGDVVECRIEALGSLVNRIE